MRGMRGMMMMMMIPDDDDHCDLIVGANVGDGVGARVGARVGAGVGAGVGGKVGCVNFIVAKSALVLQINPKFQAVFIAHSISCHFPVESHEVGFADE